MRFRIHGRFLAACLVSWAAAAQPSLLDTSKWKTFSSKAGWQVRYPADWQIGSCAQCTDPTDANVFVSLYNPATKDLMMIERLADKPYSRSVEDWLQGVSHATVMNPRVRDEWINLNGTRALRVINSNPDSTQSQNIYLWNGTVTFAIRAPWPIDSRPLIQQILSTLHF